MNNHMIEWRKLNIADVREGVQNGKSYPWILPKEIWEEGLWPEITDELIGYIRRNNINEHAGVHNLKSSWVLCANLYFPFRHDLGLLTSFLKKFVSSRIDKIVRIELEYEPDPPLDPSTLLGERKGGRGINQTSPDIAFIATTLGFGSGLVLTENKFCEHSFYECSGRKTENGNPDTSRCMKLDQLIEDLPNQCWQMQWETTSRPNRKYWKYFKLSDWGFHNLHNCPAAISGYQIFRQQALAEAIAQNSDYEFVFSSVAYDERNQTLVRCMENNGVTEFAKDWSKLFMGKASFTCWTHQQWVNWVRVNDESGRWKNWIDYVSKRYGY